MSKRIDEAAKTASRYATFKDLVDEGSRTSAKIFGWVGEAFYEVYPGGRSINWTSSVSREICARVTGSLVRSYIALDRKKSIELFRIDQLQNEPCKRHLKFTGTRAPNGCCRPCLDRYIDYRKTQGDVVCFLPPGWTPF